LGGYTYDKHQGGDKYVGSFVQYVKAFCGAVAEYIEGQRSQEPAMIGLAKTLRNIEEHGVHVRDGIKLSGIRAIALREAMKMRLPHDHAIVLAAVRDESPAGQRVVTHAPGILADLEDMGLIRRRTSKNPP
jgi:hypothetical protein